VEIGEFLTEADTTERNHLRWPLAFCSTEAAQMLTVPPMPVRCFYVKGGRFVPLTADTKCATPISMPLTHLKELHHAPFDSPTECKSA